MKILVAEDDAVTREAVVTLLQTEGHHLIEAANGKEAIDRWNRERPELDRKSVV